MNCPSSRPPFARMGRVFQVERLEPRVVPSALNVTLGGTASTLIPAGDTGDAGGTAVVTVTAGAALVFVTDLNSNGAYDPGELTGIAVADGTALSVLHHINGDIVTNLDPDGTLSDGVLPNDGLALLPATLRGLNLAGSVGKILAGQDILNATVQDAAELRTGTAAGGHSFDFTGGLGAPITLLPFTPPAGADGGDIRNLRLLAGNGPLFIALGDGGASPLKHGGDAGEFSAITIVNNGPVTVLGGRGGDGFKNGGRGTEFSDFSITTTGAGGHIIMDAGGGGNVLDLPGARGSGGAAGDFLRGILNASGDVLLNGSGGDGGSGTKRGGDGSSIEFVRVLDATAITLQGTKGGDTPDAVHLDGSRGRGGVGGHISGKLNVFADPTLLHTTSGPITLLAGHGGSGGRGGGPGGGIFGFDIRCDGNDNVLIVSGNGANFAPLTGSKRGFGGYGGSISSLTIATNGDVTVVSGNGGGGSTAGGPGGAVNFLYVSRADDVIVVGGNGGGFSAFPANSTENSDVGGSGGSLLNNRVGGLPGDSISGNVTFLAGNGYGSTTDLRVGGVGGSIQDAVISTPGNIILLGGNGGEASNVTPNIKSSVGGRGGFLSRLVLTANDVTVQAGSGGDGINGGGGGFVSDATVTASGEANLFAGNGGDATARKGGDGGHLGKIQGNGFMRALVAGDGGASTGGTAGNGGSISRVNVAGDIGDFTAPYGVGGMGGLFAGAGLRAGDVTDVLAFRIANIVAGTAASPLAANFIGKITATGGGIEAIGSDLDNDGAFDFDDSPTVNGVFDVGLDFPIDGLVLANVLGTITGATLYTLETSTGISTGTAQPN